MSDIADQSAPEIENPAMSVTILREKFGKLMVGKITVKEFWDNEGLFNILLYFSDNYRNIGMSDRDKDMMVTIMSNVTPKLISWEEAKTAGNLSDRDIFDGQLRKMYTDALAILGGCVKSRKASSDSSANPKSAAQQRPDQITKVILRFFDVLECISLINSTAKRCVLEANIPNNYASYVSTALMGTGHCDSFCRDYEALSKNIDTLLPPEKWDTSRREKAQEAFEKINGQIDEIARCFKKIAERKEQIESEVVGLHTNYRQYCEITIAEILTAKVV